MEIIQAQGNVVSAMTTRTNASGKEFGVLPIAISVGSDETHFVDLLINGGLIAVVEQRATKGRSVYVTGRPRLAPRADGDTVYPNFSLSVDEFQFVDDKGGSRGLLMGTAIGRLVADPDMRQTRSGDPVGSFRMAVDHGFGDNKETAFIGVSAFGRSSKAVEYLSKGQRATVVGNVRPRAYQRRDGEPAGELSYTVTNLVLGARSGESAEAGEPDADWVADYDNAPF